LSMTERAQQLQETADRAERNVLDQLNVRALLSQMTASPDGLARFAEAFYFCRVGFVRLNFILGARCADDERLWVGLARNLWEEAGGGATPPHNTLYRRFLNFSTKTPESALKSPPFATSFDQQWETFVRSADVLDALVAFAVYEALDAPDYQMLHDALLNRVPDAQLEFFKVHTDVRHVELFDDALALVSPTRIDSSAAQAMEFVVGLQERMWRGLLEYVRGDAAATSS
jgi:hypothetical protein